MLTLPLTRSEAMACTYIVFGPASGRIVAATDELATLRTACAEIANHEWSSIPAWVVPKLRVLNRRDGRTYTVTEVATELVPA